MNLKLLFKKKPKRKSLPNELLKILKESQRAKGFAIFVSNLREDDKGEDVLDHFGLSTQSFKREDFEVCFGEYKKFVETRPDEIKVPGFETKPVGETVEDKVE